MKTFKPLLFVAPLLCAFVIGGCGADETVPPKKLVDDMNKQRTMQGSGPQPGGATAGAPGGAPAGGQPQTDGK